MIRKINEADCLRLIEIWESAVLHTHDFLCQDDFLYYKKRLPKYFQHVALFGFEQDGKLAGFIGVAEGSIEMLFVHNEFRGNGIGKKLALYAIDNLQASKVDVNEQNTQAVGFYKHMGFSVESRSELDGDGKAYPILHMYLVSKN